MKKFVKLSLIMAIAFVWGQKNQKPEKGIDFSELPNQIILSDSLEENSGLQYVNGFLYTFNDSGGKAEIYKLDLKTGKIIQTISLKKTKNIDFEDIAYDGKNLYLADIGNNYGRRKDLVIYVVNISKINPNNPFIEIAPRTLKFSLVNQFDYEKKEPHTTNYDMEALIYYEGNLHFFTKEWSKNQTTHYTLDTNMVYQNSYPVETYTTNALVTGADIKDGVLYLSAYTKDGKAYIFTFDNFSEGKFFNGTTEKYLIGLSPSIGQIEGITVGENVLYLSGEKFQLNGFEAKQKLYTLPLSQLK